ncbi:MAG: hypothetical protein WC162_11520 [Sphaerochaetaceae bacterium]
MERKITIILIILLFSLSILSATLVEKQLTAIKYGTVEGSSLPEANASVRILNPSSIQLASSGGNIQIPIQARENNYKAFSWSFSGNLYGNIELKFTSSPMETELLEGGFDYLPYSIKYQSETSGVGNTQIPYIGSSYVGTIDFTVGETVYEFQYADKIKINNILKSSYEDSNETLQFLIGDITQKEVSFLYNLENGSTVTGGTGTYCENVCNQWNRNGYALVTIDVSGESIGTYSSGRYLAPIQVEIIGI